MDSMNGQDAFCYVALALDKVSKSLRLSLVWAYTGPSFIRRLRCIAGLGCARSRGVRKARH